MEALAEFFELVAHALDLKVEGEVALRGVVKVLADFGALAVVALEQAALGLPRGGIRMRGVERKVEQRGDGVARADAVGDEQPGLLAEGTGEEKFILRVGAAAKLRIRQRRAGGGVGGFRAVGYTDDLDEARAALDFPTEHVAQVAVLGAEDVLALGLETLAPKDVRDALAGALELARDRADEDAGEVGHGRGVRGVADGESLASAEAMPFPSHRATTRRGYPPLLLNIPTSATASASSRDTGARCQEGKALRRGQHVVILATARGLVFALSIADERLHLPDQVQVLNIHIGLPFPGAVGFLDFAAMHEALEPRDDGVPRLLVL